MDCTIMGKDKISLVKRQKAANKLLGIIIHIQNNGLSEPEYPMDKYLPVLSKMEEQLRIDPTIASKELMQISSALESQQNGMMYDYKVYMFGK